MIKDWNDAIHVVTLNGTHYIIELWTADGVKIPHHYIDDVFTDFQSACSEATRRAQQDKGFAFQDSSSNLCDGAILSCLWPPFKRKGVKS